MGYDHIMYTYVQLACAPLWGKPVDCENVAYDHIMYIYLQLACVPEGGTSAQQVFQEKPLGGAAETVSGAQ